MRIQTLLVAFYSFFLGLPIMHSQAEEPLAHSLLWEITHPEIDHSNYIFGTIHIIEEEEYFLPKGLLTSIDEADRIVFEIDMRLMNDMSQMFSLMGKIMMRGDTSLRDLYTAEEYREVADYFKAKGLPLTFFEKMKPMFLSAMTSMDQMPQGGGDIMNGFSSSGMRSYEMELMEIAEASKKDIGGVETIDFQIQVFDRIPYEQQAQYLLETIRNADKTQESQLEQLTKLYISQNIDEMSRVMKSEEPNSDSDYLEQILLVERNEKWIPRMYNMMKEAPCLFAVGAGHLGGEKGVIRLLKEEGFSVRPIHPVEEVD